VGQDDQLRVWNAVRKDLGIFWGDKTVVLSMDNQRWGSDPRQAIVRLPRYDPEQLRYEAQQRCGIATQDLNIRLDPIVGRLLIVDERKYRRNPFFSWHKKTREQRVVYFRRGAHRFSTAAIGAS
jgi:hypothetical protein